MKGNLDWYPTKLSKQKAMYANVLAKIDNYKERLGLSDEFVAEVKLVCQTFVTAYDAVMQNRAAKKKMDAWFKDIVESPQTENLITSVPAFQTISLPAGAMVGVKKKFRSLMGLLKKNLKYTRADGIDLMIVAPETEDLNLTDAAPNLKLSVDANGTITAVYVRGRFSGIELQWREVGETEWHLADKTTERAVEFKPPSLIAETPAKLEFRAAFLLKNKRVGQWSPTYSLTIG